MITQGEMNRVVRRELHRLYPGASIRVSTDFVTKIKWVDGVTPSQMINSISHLRSGIILPSGDFMRYSKNLLPSHQIVYPETARFYTEDFLKTALRGFFVAYSAPVEAIPYREKFGFWWARFHPNILPGFDSYFSVLFFQFINEVSGAFGKWPKIPAIKK